MFLTAFFVLFFMLFWVKRSSMRNHYLTVIYADMGEYVKMLSPYSLIWAINDLNKRFGVKVKVNGRNSMILTGERLNEMISFLEEKSFSFESAKEILSVLGEQQLFTYNSDDNYILKICICGTDVEKNKKAFLFIRGIVHFCNVEVDYNNKYLTCFGDYISLCKLQNFLIEIKQ